MKSDLVLFMSGGLKSKYCCNNVIPFHCLRTVGVICLNTGSD